MTGLFVLPPRRFFIIYKLKLFCRAKLHEGVIKDIERQKMRKVENAYLLQQQIDLTKQLRKGQADST